jgi:hypothetical protein
MCYFCSFTLQTKPCQVQNTPDRRSTVIPSRGFSPPLALFDLSSYRPLSLKGVSVMSRANPIPETIEHIAGYPNTLIIYKCPRSRFYRARAHVGQLVTRSLKTQVKAQAVQRAKDFYTELHVKRSQGQPLTESQGNFKTLAHAVIEEDQSRVNRGECKQSVVNDFKYMLDKDLLPFFGHDNVKNINHKRIEEYVAHLQERDISSQTIRNHFIQLNKVLKKAHKLELIDKLPIFPKVTVQDNPRSWLNEKQYPALLEAIKKAIRHKVVLRRRGAGGAGLITEHLLNLVQFMVNSFLRPQDIKLLQHSSTNISRSYEKSVDPTCGSWPRARPDRLKWSLLRLPCRFMSNS